MSATKTSMSLGQLTNELYILLEPCESEIRSRAIRAVQTLLGDPGTPDAAPVVDRHVGTNGSGDSFHGLDRVEDARKFFDEKAPESKLEEVAVASRFIELSTSTDHVTKDDIKDAMLAARRNFDSKNFNRDMNNAKSKGLFNKSEQPGVFTLSYHGQKYVDALPNREALKQLKSASRKPRRKNEKKSAPKK